MTTATLPMEESLDELRRRLARQEQRLEMLEAALFEATAQTVLMNDLPPREPKVSLTADTKPVAQLETPHEIRWPDKRTEPAASPGCDWQSSRVDTRGSPGLDPLAVLSTLDDVVWSISPDAQFVFLLAGAVERTFGRPGTEMQDSAGAWLEVVPEPERAELAAALRRLPQVERFELDHRIEQPTGKIRWVQTRGHLVRDWAGKPLRVDGITTDVTNRTKRDRILTTILERAGPTTGDDFLTQVVEQLVTCFDSRAALVVVPDPTTPSQCRTVALWLDGRLAPPLTFAVDGLFARDLLAGISKQLAHSARDHFPADDFLGMLRAECAVAESLIDVHGTPLGFVAVVDDRSRSDSAAMQRVLRALAPRLAVELIRHTRSEVDPASGAGATGSGGMSIAAAAGLDERIRELEDQLRKARGLETVGRLVAGVAHDFNNLLTVISGNADTVRESLPENDPVREPAELIAATACTAAGVARQLVAFGKPSTAVPVPYDANAAIRSVERLLRRVVGERVDLEMLLTPALPAVRADPGQFDQVLLNLVANARDAIPETGVITIRTATAEVGPLRAGWPSNLSGGVYIALTVTDTGVGMTDEVKARLFEPYFSTKGDAGHGIGLATVRDIVRAAGGHIEVESSPRWGTSVRVYWPKSESVAVLRRPRPSIEVEAQGETVLVVQDGDRLRDVTVMALQQAGYRVLEAADGEMGEERARYYAGPIHLVVADVGLPKLGGVELVERVRRTRPSVKVLFVSGAPPPELNGSAFLAKPYAPADLLDAARRALDNG